MSKNIDKWSRRVLWLLLGVSLLYLASRFVLTQIDLNSYEKYFADLDHPQSTSLVGPIAIKFSYYPATYADDSIKSQCAYLVGELRAYTQGWNKLEAFYSGSTLDVNGNSQRIGILPVELYGKDNSSFQIGEVDEYLYGPFEIEVLGELQFYYSMWGVPQGINTNSNLYLVYITLDVPCR